MGDRIGIKHGDKRLIYGNAVWQRSEEDMAEDEELPEKPSFALRRMRM
jgi:hypothetical protein